MADLAGDASSLFGISDLSIDEAAQDAVAIKSLQLPFGVIAPDVWGQLKEQPALISLSLLLRGGFASAADTDQLDDSTIHYGNLAKRIRASCKPNQTVDELLRSAHSSVLEMGKKGSGAQPRFVVVRSTVEVLLPKASMSGEGVALREITAYDGRGTATSFSRDFGLRDVKIMTLIGVNSYERTQKQPLVASVLLRLRSEVQAGNEAAIGALYGLEKLLVQVIGDTSYETLETLAGFTITELRKKMLDTAVPGAHVQLRIEKTRVMTFAHAPAVEVMRQIPNAKKVFTTGSPFEGLNVIRPYR